MINNSATSPQQESQSAAVIANNNFFGLDKEDVTYSLAAYSKMFLMILTGEAEAKRRAANMFSSFGNCNKIKQQDNGDIFITLDLARLHKSFSTYFYGQLYNSNLAKKHDLYYYDSEMEENVWDDTELLNQEELDAEAARLGDAFITQFIIPVPIYDYKKYGIQLLNSGLDHQYEYEANLSQATDPLAAESLLDDGEKLLDQLTRSPES